MNGSLGALNALNFFMADVRDGLGPFLGVYLQSVQWSPAQIGLVMTIGALAGMALTAPLGALVDRVTIKRALIAVAAFAIVLASFAILSFPSFIPVTVAQGVNGIAGAVILPAIAGITLGIVKQRGYAHQVGSNEAFNHAGNVTAAALAGVFGYTFGLGAGVAGGREPTASLGAAWFIDPRRIDHRAARGLKADQKDDHASSWSTLGHLSAAAGSCRDADAVPSRQRRHASAARAVAGSEGRQSQRLYQCDDHRRAAHHGSDGQSCAARRSPRPRGYWIVFALWR